MRLSRRRGRQDDQPLSLPISAFWRWWADGGAERFTEAVGTGRYGELPATIGGLVSAIDDGLEWELGPGRVSQHALCVTGGGVAALRPLAERWLRAAPPRTETWEFHAARQPDPDASTRTLQFDGHDLLLAGLPFAVTADPEADAVDVLVWHPAFPELTAKQRGQVSYLALDWLLGEDDVERWLGAISATADEPAGAVPPRFSSPRSAISRPDVPSRPGYCSKAVPAPVPG